MAAGITLFVERLPAWVAAAPGLRLPALETLLARGSELPPLPASPDRARMVLLGADSSTSVPAGALTVAADSGRVPEGAWLRADPVTLRASMTQVYLAGAGMADFDADERRQIRDAVNRELAEQGFTLEVHHPERWAVRLEDELGFDFAPLDEALGADVAEQLPSHPAARDWKRLMTDLQVVLHNHPVNEARRAAGRPVVNGVWLWGAGAAPPKPPSPPFQRIRSGHPITAGLARCFEIALEAAPGDPPAVPEDGALLVDWPDEIDAAAALERLDTWVTAAQAVPGGGALRLRAGDGAGWEAPRSRWRRFWRPRRPLVDTFGQAGHREREAGP